jgi:hypothetical protein
LSNANAGIRELAGIVNATENYLYFAENAPHSFLAPTSELTSLSDSQK